jgi:dihydroorotase
MRIGIYNALVINEGKSEVKSVLIEDGKIAMISSSSDFKSDVTINGEGLWLLPGVIDDQVHFREPGLMHKAEIQTEARAAVAGGVTSFMEMPNTIPQAVTQEELQKKYDRAAQCSVANYSFFMGGTNTNLEEVIKTDPKTVCGIKLFMGSSTGNMLVDEPEVLEKVFAQAPMIIATHCEDEETIKENLAKAEREFGEGITPQMHPIIRNHRACVLSSQKAIKLAKENNARLHVLHISTADEVALFEKGPLKNKKITSEVCVHHLSFNENDYDTLGYQIKCNPAIKSAKDQEALWEALLDDHFDVIATDHAPHTWEEKQGNYMKAPSGVPLVQHSLQLMLEHAASGRISKERVVEKMCHAPAELFDVFNRGYVREGYNADLVLVDPNDSYEVNKSNLLYKCGWSPFEGKRFQTTIHTTFVNGNIVFQNGKIFDEVQGHRLMFNRS